MSHEFEEKIKNTIDVETLTTEDRSYEIYSDACYKAATEEAAFSSFKNNPKYTYELEHTSVDLGHNYIKLAKQEFPEVLEKIIWKQVYANDFFGGTIKHRYPELSEYCGEYCKFSPTTIGYLYLSIRMCKELLKREVDNKGLDVVELGAGYGGQAYMFCIVAMIMGIKVNSYSLVDLYHANLLQEKYLKSLGLDNVVKLNFLSGKDYDEYKDKVGNVDFVISNYALSEFSIDWGERYLETFIKKSKFGFFQFNTVHKNVNGKRENLTVEDLESHYSDVLNIADPGNPDGVVGGGHPGCRLLICEDK
jgi:hypothetical protein